MSNLSNENWQKEYGEALNNLINAKEIVEWKMTRALEEAKLISIDTEFQRRIRIMQERWKVTPRITTKDLDPQTVLGERTSHLTEEEYNLLVKELEVLANDFDLDWKGEDEGLVVAALCYGLTPNNILNHWEGMKFIVARTRRPGVELVVDYHFRLKEKMYFMIIIAYLFTKLYQHGVKIDIPVVLRDILIDALKSIGKIETKERAEEIFDRVRDKNFTPALFIKLTKGTTLQDIKRTWPQVELRKAEIFKEISRSGKRRIWRTYARDIYVWKRVKTDLMTSEGAYNEWLLHHPDEEPVEISAVIKSVGRIETLPDETDFNPES